MMDMNMSDLKGNGGRIWLGLMVGALLGTAYHEVVARRLFKGECARECVACAVGLIPGAAPIGAIDGSVAGATRGSVATDSTD